MDTNAFSTKDELRRQVDTFTGKVNRGTSHIFTTSDGTILVVLVFFCRIGPTLRSPGRHHLPERSQHRQTAPRRPLQEGVERGPGGRPSPMRHLDEDGHTFGLEEVRDERDSQVSRGCGNDVPVDYETISHHRQNGEVCLRTAPSRASSRAPRGASSGRRT